MVSERCSLSGYISSLRKGSVVQEPLLGKGFVAHKLILQGLYGDPTRSRHCESYVAGFKTTFSRITQVNLLIIPLVSMDTAYCVR